MPLLSDRFYYDLYFYSRLRRQWRLVISCLEWDDMLRYSKRIRRDYASTAKLQVVHLGHLPAAKP